MQRACFGYDHFDDDEDDDNDDNDDDVRSINESTQLLKEKKIDNVEETTGYQYNFNNLEKELEDKSRTSTRNDYTISDYLDYSTKEENTELDYFTYTNDIYEEFETIEENDSRISAQILDYDMNYTLKQLEHILGYYDIQKKKMNKIEIIETIVQIENNIENKNIITKRKEMFNYAELLKKDKYFGKYIMFNN